MNDINSILNKLLEYYDIDTMAELSEILKVSQPTISKWKSRNTIIPIKRKCKEIGIYEKIFDNNTLDDFDFSKIPNIKELKKQCKKYNITTTIIDNQKILKLIEDIFTVANRNINEDELEKDLIDLFFKYNPNIDRNTFPMNDFLKPNITPNKEKDIFIEKFEKRINHIKKQKEIGYIDDEELDERLFELGRDFNKEIEKYKAKLKNKTNEY